LSLRIPPGKIAIAIDMVIRVDTKPTCGGVALTDVRNFGKM
jgi:hypothetical protein